MLIYGWFADMDAIVVFLAQVGRLMESIDVAKLTIIVIAMLIVISTLVSYFWLNDAIILKVKFFNEHKNAF